MAKENAVQEKSAVREVLSWLITILLAVLAALVIKNFIIINANIPSGSMENTINVSYTHLTLPTTLLVESTSGLDILLLACVV